MRGKTFEKLLPRYSGAYKECSSISNYKFATVEIAINSYIKAIYKYIDSMYAVMQKL
jgi:hypothetical protein